MNKKYLIIAKIQGQIDYKIVSNPNALYYEYHFFIDYGKARKPDFIIELPSSESELEKILKKLGEEE